MIKLNIYSFAFTMLLMTSLTFIGCQQNEELPTLTPEASSQQNSTNFDFDNFGITHNAYLDYVRQIPNAEDPKARFLYGKTFVSPVFGSFNNGISWEEMRDSFAGHMARVEAISGGTYDASSEELSPAMTDFLNGLASLAKTALDDQLSVGEFQHEILLLEANIKRNQAVTINLTKGTSNDGAAMLAICSILRYSLDYWENDASNQKAARPGFGQRVKRALADAWGYVSDWQPNGDGSYTWSHGSALVNADCVSDGVYEN